MRVFMFRVIFWLGLGYGVGHYTLVSQSNSVSHTRTTPNGE